MKNNNKENGGNQDYLSLKEATKFCSYSQEYLSLRARQGKLKSVKLGRNWATTKEWLEDYTGKVVEYNNSINNIKTKKEEIIKAELIKHSSPPENLPIVRFPNLKLSLGNLRSGFIAILVLVLMAAGGVFDKESLIISYNDFSPYMEEVGKAGYVIIKDSAQGLSEVYRDIARFSDDFYVAAVNYRDTTEFASDVFSEYGQWLKNQIIK